ncbi:MAG: ROK family protein [Saprospiraceae bacterium]|nr:ROK family protein [Saprospiraceae bacterium]
MTPGSVEREHGKGKGVKGLVVFLTLGTGIGSALFYNGQLLANTKIGAPKYKKIYFEKYDSNSAREFHHLSWRKWAKNLMCTSNHLDALLSPDTHSHKVVE